MKSPASTPTLEEFLATCHAACDFLVQEFGFVRMETPREFNPFSVRYRKGELGVELYGESWGESAACDLLRGSDNLYLGLLVPRVERKKPSRKAARPGQLEQIHTLAAVLKLHAADFLSGDCARFDAALAEWRRVTRHREPSEAQKIERQLQEAVAEAGHASKRGEHAEVVRRLEPHEKALSAHQRRMLETARRKLGGEGD